MLRNLVHLMVVAVLVLNSVTLAEACNRASKTSRVKRTVCSTRPCPAPPAKCKVYCICYPDAQGIMRLQGTTTDRAKAQRAAKILEKAGIKAWAMEMRPVPQGGGLTLSNGDAAIAIAYNIGPGKTRAVAIGKCGRAEAIAQG